MLSLRCMVYPNKHNMEIGYLVWTWTCVCVCACMLHACWKETRRHQRTALCVSPCCLVAVLWASRDSVPTSHFTLEALRLQTVLPYVAVSGFWGFTLRPSWMCAKCLPHWDTSLSLCHHNLRRMQTETSPVHCFRLRLQYLICPSGCELTTHCRPSSRLP